ncbi:MAG: Gfo/Idh/MocA family oxidoreductase [SAR324 cluster bacterium]|nr:Gfo/Idh/MocA family oxidoreductase [SAR324 cluster bacterium]
MNKLNWGMIGGGEGSQIGLAHRIGAGLDGKFQLAAGALDIVPEKSRAYGVQLGIDKERAYGNWKEMLAGELKRSDRVDLVTVATPNETHFEITKAFLENGFDVLCEKPMTMNPEEGKSIVEIAKKQNRICAVNYGYTGYPLVRHMRAAVKRGDLGKIRVVHAEFAGGFFADAADANNPRVRWRFDPKQAGVSAVTGDAGIHALHMACFVTAQEVSSLSADFATCVEGRTLEDDSLIAFRMTEGTVGRLWTSGLAIGRTHGLTIQVFGEKGGFRWQQEHPNQLFWTPLGHATQILERGGAGLSAEADRASRVTVGHAEGMPLAFANIYRDLGEVIQAKREGLKADPLAEEYPTAEDGFRSIAVIFAAVESAKHDSKWVELNFDE